MPVREAAHRKTAQRLDRGRCRRDTRQGTGHREWRGIEERRGGYTARARAHEPEHARDGDAELLVLREEKTGEAAEVGHEAEIGHEEREVADRERAVAHGLRAEQQDE